MAINGINSENLPLLESIDEVLGLDNSAGSVTGRAPVAELATVLAGQDAFAGQVQLPEAPAAGDAFRALQINEGGDGVDLRPRKETVLLGYSQSNFAYLTTVAWVTPPPQNLSVWNGGNWNGDLVPPLGTAFVAADPTKVSVPIAWAAEYARDHPEENVRLIVIARGGTGVRHVVGVDYVYQDGLSGDPGAGGLGFDSATASLVSGIRYSETGDDGFKRFLGASILQASGYYPARVEVIGSETTSYIEFLAGGSYTDEGAWRSQALTYSSSASWPPADGTPVRVFGGGPRMKEVLTANVEAAFTWLGLTGASRVFDKIFLWPTESDINYYDSYRAVDFPKLMEILSTWATPETSYLFTLPWPFGEGIASARTPWYDAISAIVVENFNTRKLVSLEGTGADAWTDANKIHVAGSSQEAVGRYIYRAEVRGGTSPRTLDANKYTPVLTAVANVDAVTAYPLRYMRVGANTSVDGLVGSDATAASSTATEIGIGLPFASDFILGTECSGQAIAVGVNNYGTIGQDGANDRAKLVYSSIHTTTILFSIHFNYEIKPF